MPFGTRAEMNMPDPVPARTIRRVGLVAKARLHEAANHIDAILDWLDERGLEPVLETDTAGLATGAAGRATCRKDDLPRRVDLVLVLGGDGTLLGMASRIAVAGAAIPILGVNFGSLGFLTEVTLPELYRSLESAVAGTAEIDRRMMLRARVLRADRAAVERIVLNDVVVTRGALSRIIDLSVSVESQFVARFKADGLIVATPTGSTAYNLAAGGPIIEPAVDAMVLTPIAPHTLTNRPIVIPGDSEVRIQPLVDDYDEIVATFDGQFGYPLQADDVVAVRRAEQPMLLVRASTRSYFEILRQKLRWAER
jgi:NAD+ kinase